MAKKKAKKTVKKTLKKTAPAKKTSKKSAQKSTPKKPKKTAKKWTHQNCHYCLEKIEPGEDHDCLPLSEADLFRDLNIDLQDAFSRLRECALELGEQRIYNNARAVMFSRRVCYMFVRPKKAYLELVFFLRRKEIDSAIYRVDEVSKTKFSHTVRLIHSDQVEAPLVDWLREAYEQSV